MHKLTGPLIVAAIAILGLSGCGEAQKPAKGATQTVVHAAGTSEIPAAPHKVIVFDTGMLDTMDALGIPVAGVPQKTVHLPSFLSKYLGSDYINAGGFFEPDFQALSAAAPDLIIGGGRAKKAYGELAKIAPTIDLEIDDTHFIDSFHQRTMQLGEIFGKKAEAKAALDQLDQQAAAVKAKAASAGSGMLIMINGGKISAFGPGSRFSFLYDALGFKPPVELPDKGLHGNAMSFELLLQADPDWLFVINRDAAIGTQGNASAEQVLDNELVNKTKAKRLGHIVYLDSAEMYLGGGIQTYKHLTGAIDRALSATP